MRFLSIFLVIIIGSSFSPDDQLASYYIDEYKDLAIAEMMRSGIPASITLAQALHESNNGTSNLAKEANNHFGIKCKSYWKGEKYAHKDDDYKNGELINSCFRAYPSHVESFIDHSNFLMHSDNYVELFLNIQTLII